MSAFGPNQRSHYERLHPNLPYNKHPFYQITNKCKFMPGDYIFSSKGKRNCHTILSFQPNPLSVWSLGEGVGVGYFQTTRHTFSFQSSVYTKNILVTHFHHNPMVSMFSVKTVTDAPHRREGHKSHSICLFCPWSLSLSHVSPRAFISLIFRTEIYEWGFTIKVLHVCNQILDSLAFHFSNIFCR